MKGKILARIVLFAALLFVPAWNTMASTYRCDTCTITYSPQKDWYVWGDVVTVTAAGFPPCPDSASYCGYYMADSTRTSEELRFTGSMQPPTFQVTLGTDAYAWYFYNGYTPYVEMDEVLCALQEGRLACDNSKPIIPGPGHWVKSDRYLPVAHIQFVSPVVNSSVPLLLHNYGSSGYLVPQQTEDLAMPIKVKVTKSSGSFEQPLAGFTVYFDAADPPDTTAYRTDAHEGDNTGGLATAIVDGDGKSDADGYITAKLVAPEGAHGGDNYQVKAALDSAFSCGSNCPKSGTITAWKRGFIENTRMWKVGQFITADSGAGTANPAQVFVSSTNGFHSGDAIHLVSADYPGGEARTIVSIDSRKNIITLNSALTLPWPKTVIPGVCDPSHGSDPSRDAAAFTPYCAAYPYSFIARDVGGLYDIQPGTMKFSDAFGDAFVDWVVLPGYIIPSWPIVTKASPADFDKFIQDRTLPFFKNRTAKNHVQVVSAADYNVGGLPGVIYALTKSDALNQSENYTWIFSERIKSRFHSNANNALISTSVHEMAHHWNVNQGDPFGHDTQNARTPLIYGTSSDPLCLMNTSRNREAGIQRLHSPLTPTMDLYCIRGHVDNLFQNTCTWTP